jgi:hypothetical protein
MSHAPAYRRALVSPSEAKRPCGTHILFRPIVFEHLSALLFASTQYSVLLIERAVVGLLRLCLILARKVECRYLQSACRKLTTSVCKSSLRDQIYVSFDLLAGLPPTVAGSVTDQVVSGVILIVQKHKDIIRFATCQPASITELQIPFPGRRQSGISSLPFSVPQSHSRKLRDSPLNS